jgi:hypothetical protein
MIDGVLTFAQRNPFLSLILGVVGLELITLIGVYTTLVIRSFRKQQQAKSKETFFENYSSDIEEALSDRKSIVEVTDKLDDSDRQTVRAYLVDRMRSASDEQVQWKLSEIYHRLGFSDEDQKELSGGDTEQRIQALSRVSTIPEVDEVEAIDDAVEEDTLSELLAVKAYVQLGEKKKVLARFRHLTLENRFLSEPYHGVLSDADDELVEYLLQHWEQIESPYIQRVVLARGVEIEASLAFPVLEKAFFSDDKELRIGAVQSADAFSSAVADERLISALRDDPAWEVRAVAARQVGKIGSRLGKESFLPFLREALRDRAFAVRRNAADALSRYGSRGEKHLKEAMKEEQDNFARDVAREQISRNQIERNTHV